MLHLPDEGSVSCPHLTQEKTCGVYHERYKPGSDDLVVVGYWKSRRYRDLSGKPVDRPFWCGRMAQLHKAGMIPSEIESGCAIIHPELLEVHENTSKA